MPSDSSDDGNQLGKEKKDHPRKRKNSGTHQADDTHNEKLEAMEKKFTEQQRWFEEQMEKKDRELEMMNREVEENRNRWEQQEEARKQQPSTAATPPMKKGEIPTVVVEINQGNRELVSIEHNGMIVNPDGTLSRTPQYETWTKNKKHQLKETYETTPRLPEYLNSIPDHPPPTNLRQRWSHMGDWYEAPTNPEQEGIEFEESRVARIEPYIYM